MHSLLPKLFPGMFLCNIRLILHGECIFQLESQILLEQGLFYLVFHPSKGTPYNILLHEENKWKDLLARSGALDLRVRTVEPD